VAERQGWNDEKQAFPPAVGVRQRKREGGIVKRKQNEGSICASQGKERLQSY